MEIKSNAAQKDTSFQHFCAIPCISYWRSQLHASNIKNLNTGSVQIGGTKKCYTYGLFGFHKWLCGKQFHYTTTIQTNRNTLSMQQRKVVLKGVAHLLHLYQHHTSKKTEFVTLVKKYLIHLQANKSASTTDNAMFSIKSFFRENDAEMNFRFTNTKHRNDPMIENTMTLDDMKKILSVKGIQSIERAVFLCKFHRGLDSATFADRFNFDAWSQITKYFGTDNPRLWDLSRCPVPVKLVRVKTNYLHTGFLDTDAIIALQEYLKKRTVSKTSRLSIPHSTRGRKSDVHNRKKPLEREALFLDTLGNPISINWIGRRFGKLRKNSGLNKTYSSHEVRDLLKSTLIDSGCRPDIADHVIGHTPKDSYEKQALLYPDSIRTEFMKASNRINTIRLSTSCKNRSNHKAEQTKHDCECKHMIERLLGLNLQINTILLQMKQNCTTESFLRL